LPHVLWLGALSLLVHLSAELRGEHNLVAALTERATQLLFALRSAVDVGCVEEADAGLERGVDDR